MAEHEWIPVHIGMPNIGIGVEVRASGGREAIASRGAPYGDWREWDGEDWVELKGTVTHWRRASK